MSEKILIIDDDTKFIAQISEILKQYNLEIGFTTKAEDALKILGIVEYDLIILDVNMPIINGFEILKELKSSKTHKLIPVLMSTSDSNKEVVLKAIQQGADDYMVKPIEENILIKKIDILLKIRKFVKRWGVLPK